MPKRVSADALRVPLNCLIAPATKTAIASLQNETKESQGEIVDRAVALLAFGEEIQTETFVEKAKRTVNHPPLSLPPVHLGGQTLTTTSTRDGRTVHTYRGVRQKGDKER